MNSKQVYDSRAAVKENVEYVLRDKDGNLKPLWDDNIIGQTLLRFFRWLCPEPYEILGYQTDEFGEPVYPVYGDLKKGLLPKLALYGIRIPFLLGNWTLSLNRSNLITNAGRALISGLINGSGSPAAATFIAVGTGTTAASASDTTLQTESSTSGLSRAAGTVSLVTTSVTNDTAQVTKTFSVTGSVAVTEAGLLNASSSGTLLAHQVFSAINVANTDSLQITWKAQNA